MERGIKWRQLFAGDVKYKCMLIATAESTMLCNRRDDVKRLFVFSGRSDNSLQRNGCLPVNLHYFSRCFYHTHHCGIQYLPFLSFWGFKWLDTSLKSCADIVRGYLTESLTDQLLVSSSWESKGILQGQAVYWTLVKGLLSSICTQIYVWFLKKSCQGPR